jgi:hypothetical protein
MEPQTSKFLGPDLTIVLNANLRGGQEAQRDADSNLLQQGASCRTSSVCMLTVVAIVIALPAEAPETETRNKAEETVPDLQKWYPGLGSEPSQGRALDSITYAELTGNFASVVCITGDGDHGRIIVTGGGKENIVLKMDTTGCS